MSDANRQLALAFLRHAAAGEEGPLRALVAPGARHHNPHFPAGMDALIAGMMANARQFPGKRLKVHHVLAEGDLVATHAHVVHGPGAPEAQVMHLFRFAKGLVVELWDVGVPLDPASPNRDGPF